MIMIIFWILNWFQGLIITISDGAILFYFWPTLVTVCTTIKKILVGITSQSSKKLLILTQETDKLYLSRLLTNHFYYTNSLPCPYSCSTFPQWTWAEILGTAPPHPPPSPSKKKGENICWSEYFCCSGTISLGLVAKVMMYPVDMRIYDYSGPVFTATRAAHALRWDQNVWLLYVLCSRRGFYQNICRTN